MHHNAPLQAFNRIRLAAALVLVVTAAVAFSSAGQAAVFGTDERTRLDYRHSDLQQKIGTLTAAGSGAFCTGFCVAPDMIATASHCLFGTAASPGPKLRDLNFKLGASSLFEPGTPIAGRAVGNQSQHIISGTRRLAVTPPIGAADDWAVAQLERPLCSAGRLPITTKSHAAITAAAARGAIYQVAAHSDVSDAKLRRSGPCAIADPFTNARRTSISRDFRAPHSILFHTCDTGGGSSGSPLLIDTPNGPEVVALNVGTYVLARAIPTARNESATGSNGAPIANTAIDVTQLSVAIAELADSDTLTQSAEIRRVEELLRDGGLYYGAINGRATRGLIEAVKRFEDMQGYAASGRLTRKLLANVERWQQSRTTQMMMFAPLPSHGESAPRRP